MRLVRFDSPAEFLNRSESFLAGQEARNSLLLGVAINLVDNPDVYTEQPYLAIVEKNGALITAALHTPPWPLLLVDSPGEALQLIVQDLALRGERLPGVNGPAEVSGSFVRLWCESVGGKYEIALEELVYQLTVVAERGSAPGEFRRAGTEDLSLAIDWGGRFLDDVGLDDEKDQIGDAVKRMVDQGRLHFWQDVEIVSMAAWARPTLHGATVNFVYTPPELRGMGYATSCVSALSGMLLDSGRKYCFLYTDKSNPTSNSIYQKIGYRQVSEATYYRISD